MDRQAEFEAYARARQQQLYRTAYLLCGDPDTARDLVQTTLVKIFTAWRRASRAEHPDAYAKTVLTRTYVDQQRRLRRERTAHTLADPLPPGGQADVRVTVLAALAQLPPKQRAALVLRYWEDQSVEATAIALRCSTGTVKSQCARALAKLRELLGSSYAELTEI